MGEKMRKGILLILMALLVWVMLPVMGVRAEETAVASFNGNQYTSLQKAVDAASIAQNGMTIDLLQDIDLTETMKRRKRLLWT